MLRDRLSQDADSATMKLSEAESQANEYAADTAATELVAYMEKKASNSNRFGVSTPNLNYSPMKTPSTANESPSFALGDRLKSGVNSVKNYLASPRTSLGRIFESNKDSQDDGAKEQTNCDVNKSEEGVSLSDRTTRFNERQMRKKNVNDNA